MNMENQQEARSNKDIRALYNPSYVRSIDAYRHVNRIKIAKNRYKPKTNITKERAEFLKGVKQQIAAGSPMEWSDAELIIAAIAAQHGVSAQDITGPLRFHQIMKARDAAIRLIADAFPDATLQKIGQLFGNRDHSTIHHSLRKTRKPGQKR